MDVQASNLGPTEYFWRKNHSVGGDDEEVEVCNQVFATPQIGWRNANDAVAVSLLLDRT
jgi:hypothetical protein